jgi:hypothetical protein
MFYRFRLLQFHVLQITAVTIPCFTDSGFYNSISCFTDSGFYNSGFYRFRLLQFHVLQIPAFTILGHSIPHSIPFRDSPFRVLQVARSKQILSRVVIVTLVVVAQYYLFLELLWLRRRRGTDWLIDWWINRLTDDWPYILSISNSILRLYKYTIHDGCR